MASIPMIRVPQELPKLPPAPITPKDTLTQFLSHDRVEIHPDARILADLQKMVKSPVGEALLQRVLGVIDVTGSHLAICLGDRDLCSRRARGAMIELAFPTDMGYIARDEEGFEIVVRKSSDSTLFHELRHSVNQVKDFEEWSQTRDLPPSTPRKTNGEEERVITGENVAGISSLSESDYLESIGMQRRINHHGIRLKGKSPEYMTVLYNVGSNRLDRVRALLNHPKYAPMHDPRSTKDLIEYAFKNDDVDVLSYICSLDFIDPDVRTKTLSSLLDLEISHVDPRSKHLHTMLQYIDGGLKAEIKERGAFDHPLAKPENTLFWVLSAATSSKSSSLESVCRAPFLDPALKKKTLTFLAGVQSRRAPTVVGDERLVTYIKLGASTNELDLRSMMLDERRSMELRQVCATLVLNQELKADGETPDEVVESCLSVGILAEGFSYENIMSGGLSDAALEKLLLFPLTHGKDLLTIWKFHTASYKDEYDTILDEKRIGVIEYRKLR
ncbi:MAG: hypothetical protein MRY21_07615 [Simkaniaceae bacterium]|nr:hypothetical protein [Simkaniaceae bacterium]